MRANPIIPSKVEIQKKQTQMTIQWQRGDSSEIHFDELRKHCACAFCRTSGNLGTLKPENDTEVVNAVPMGSTGLQIIFADGHDKGIYPWGYLEAIGDGRGMNYFNELD